MPLGTVRPMGQVFVHSPFIGGIEFAELLRVRLEFGDSGFQQRDKLRGVGDSDFLGAPACLVDARFLRHAVQVVGDVGGEHLLIVGPLGEVNG